MYTRLNKNRTKKYYKEIVENVLKETQENVKMFPSISMYVSILNQLKDIQDNIISIIAYHSMYHNRFVRL